MSAGSREEFVRQVAEAVSSKLETALETLQKDIAHELAKLQVTQTAILARLSAIEDSLDGGNGVSSTKRTGAAAAKPAGALPASANQYLSRCYVEASDEEREAILGASEEKRQERKTAFQGEKTITSKTGTDRLKAEARHLWAKLFSAEEKKEWQNRLKAAKAGAAAGTGGQLQEEE